MTSLRSSESFKAVKVEERLKNASWLKETRDDGKMDTTRHPGLGFFLYKELLMKSEWVSR